MYHLDGNLTSDTILSSVFKFTTRKAQTIFKKKEDMEVQVQARPQVSRNATQESVVKPKE